MSATSSAQQGSTQEREWEREQEELAARVVHHDAADWLLQPGGWAANLRLVAGLDVSFFLDQDQAGGSGAGAGDMSSPPTAAPGRAVAALAVLSFPSLQPVHVALLDVPVLGAPYRPGFLGFREVPAYLQLLRSAAEQGFEPQLLLVDGFGVLHPRRCGSASHLGVLAGLPTVGVAKSLLRIEGLPAEREVRAAAAAAAAALEASAQPAEAAARPAGEPGVAPHFPGLHLHASSIHGSSIHSSGSPNGGDEGSASTVHLLPDGGFWLPLAATSGEVLGAALCAGDGRRSSGVGTGASLAAVPRRPVFVSAGHRVGLASAVAIVQRCSRHRVPEPIRQADLLSRAEVRRQQQAVAAAAATQTSSASTPVISI